MKVATQRDFVVSKLKQDGEITRNFALQNFISRLGAIICDLNKNGWQIDGEYRKYDKGKDFVYKVVTYPPKSPHQLMHEKFQSGEDLRPTLI